MGDFIMRFQVRARISMPLAMIIGLSSCAIPGIGGRKVEAPKLESPFGATGVPPQLRASGSDTSAPVVPGGGSQGAASAAAFTPEEDIVFTDPDNPDATLPELSTILTDSNKKRGPWEESETIAKQRAAREGRPLLIWFTDSARSPMCKALSEELFSTPDFEAWASENLIRFRVDANIVLKDEGLSMDEENTRRANIKDYVTRLKKRYKVLGHPSLILLNPSGEVVSRFRGYKRGQADFTWGQIKHGTEVSAKAYQEWRAKLEKKGYREWSDRRGHKVFAKLTGYSEGKLTLIEPDGTRSQTRESKLSDEDQEWISGQKRLRGFQ